MLRLVGGLLLACSACALGLAVFGQWPVRIGFSVSLMCSGLAWALMPWWAPDIHPAPTAVAADNPISIPAADPIAPLEIATPPKKGSVAPFMAERLARIEGARLATADLFEAYRNWCDEKGLAALDAEPFSDRLSTICDSAGIRRGKGYALLNVTLAK